MNSGEIWFARFYYDDDATRYKDRPVYIISDTNVALCAKITTHAPREKYGYEYEIVEWENAGLEKPSTIRLSQQLIIPQSDFQFRIGRLDSNDILNVQKILLQM